MSTAVEPHDLAGAARELLRDDGGRTAGVWPRAAAVLARQAIELGLERLWDLRCPGLQITTMRAQLLCLRHLLKDPDLAGRVAVAHGALSRVLHHSATDTAPVHSELLRWIEVAWQLADRVVAEERQAALVRLARAGAG